MSAAAARVPKPASSEAEEWSIEDPKAPTETLDFEATEGTWMSVDVSPDGRSIVFDLLGHLYEMPFEGGEAKPLTRGRSWNQFPRYSPDGTRIAFTSDRSGRGGLWILERASGSLTDVKKKDMQLFRASWAADGRHLYATGIDKSEKILALHINLQGGHQELARVEDSQNLGQFVDDAARNLVYYEHNDPRPGEIESAPYARGVRIKAYDKRTGETSVRIQRPGGAFNPALSSDARRIAYLHRDDLETVLVVHDLDTQQERVAHRGLDHDRQETTFYRFGSSPNMAWHPSGREILLSAGGRILAIDADNGNARPIPFRARVHRDINRRLLFQVPIPEGEVRTRLHRWTQRIPEGILFETLGDIYLKSGERARNLTRSPEHETSPVYDPRTRMLYYAAWSDRDLGAVFARGIDGGERRALTTQPAQYGSLSLSADGRTLAFLRGNGVRSQRMLEEEEEFDLVLLSLGGSERKLTQVSWIRNRTSSETQHPPVLVFSPEGTNLYFSEYVEEVLTLKRIRTDGTDETPLYRFPRAVRAIPSPDLKWIAFRESHRHYVTPLGYIGKLVSISALDEHGFTRRVDLHDGDFLGWSDDGDSLHWTRGPEFLEKRIADVLKDGVKPGATDLSVPFDVSAPDSTIALTNARVVTMDAGRDLLEDATVIVKGNRIEAVGRGLAAPAGAKVYDLRGHTLVPGFVDAHAHYNQDTSALQVIEKRLPGLAGPLAYGVTAMVEVYGNHNKDPWVSDMQRHGAIVGPRLFSVGTPIFGMHEFRPGTYRQIDSLEDAREHARYNKAHGATALKDYVNFTRASRHQLFTAAREEGLNVYAETAAEPEMNWTQVIDGVSGLEHTPGLTPLNGDVIRLLAASGVGITPTLLVVYNGPVGQTRFHMEERVWEDPKLRRFARHEDLLRYRRPVHLWRDDQYAPVMARQMKKLYDQGVSIQLGGHGQMLGLDVHWEMELLAEGGFTPLQALEVATIRGARYHGFDRQIGSIEPGKLADIVVINGNPLQDIRQTRSVAYVMLNGVMYSGEDGARVFPDPAPAGKFYFQP